MDREVLSTSYREGSTDPVQATQPLFDSFGRTIGSKTYADVVIDLAADGSTSLAGVGNLPYTTSTTYNSRGQTVSFTDVQGNITNYEYDLLGRRTAVIDPIVANDGITLRLRSETTYDSQGRVASEITNLRQFADGTIDRSHAKTTVPAYDPFGNVVSMTVTALDGQGNSQFLTTSATYDDRGRKLSETDAQGQTKNFTYDEQGRLIEVKLPPVIEPGTQNVPARPTYTYAYDARGNQTLIVDPYGRETRFTYDNQGRQISRTLPLGFGADGILGTGDDSAVPAGDFTETFEYDDLGRQILHVSFEGKVTQNVYSQTTGRLSQQRLFDNLTQYDNGNGTPTEVWSYTYDYMGRQIAVDSSTSAGNQTRTWTYDSQGRLTQTSTPEGIINYEYDIYGRKIRSFTGSNAADPINDFRYSHDNFGRLDTVTVWERNDVPLAENAREVTDYDYDLLGNLAKTINPNGVIDQYGYDSLSRLTRLTHFAPDSTPQDLSDNAKISQYDYTLRADGKKTASTEKVWIDGIERQSSFAWEYDGDGRLTDEVFTSYDELLSQTHHFTFDLVGNRLRQELNRGNNGSIDETTEYAYDSNDRMLSESNGDEETVYEYDHTQQIEKTVTDTSTQQMVSKVEYTWDVRGRLAAALVTSYSAGVASKIEKAEYRYDEKYYRVSVKTSVDPTASGTFSSYTTTTYLNDNRNFTGNSQVLEETTRDSNGAILSRKIYTLGHQRISQTAVSCTNGVPTSYVTLFFLLDARGSTRLLTDSLGAIATHNGTPQVIVYAAYGELIGLTDEQIASSFRYAGEQFDPLTQLQYNEARYAQIWSGTFLGLDPYFGDLSDPRSLHKYNYTTSRDPISFGDPTGWADASLTGSLGANTVSAKLSVGGVAFAAFNAWDKFDTLREGLTIIGTIATGGTVSTVTLGLFAVSIFPFGRFMRLAKLGGTSKLFGNLAGKVGHLPDAEHNLNKAYQKMLKAGANQTDDVLKELAEEIREEYDDEIAEMVGNVGVSAIKAAETIGELGAVAVASKLGLELVEDFPRRYHGIDFLFKNPATGKYVIVEAKGGSSTLAMTRSGIGNASDPKQVQQLSKNWIKHKMDALRKAGHEKLADEIQDQMGDGSLDVLLVSTPIAATKVVESPEFIMKNIGQIGDNSFF